MVCFASRLSRCPRQRAGFSPSRSPLAFAQSRTRSIRPRKRSAVVGFPVQIGSSTRSTWLVSISRTGKLPITGKAKSFSDCRHCCRWVASVQPLSCAARKRSAACLNVVAVAAASLACVRFSRRASTGSLPSSSWRRAAFCPLAGFLKGDGVQRPEAVHVFASVSLIAKQPRFRSAGADLQKQTVPVVVAARLL